MLRKVVNRQLQTYKPYDAIKLTATVCAAIRLLLRLRQIHRNEGLRAWVVSSIVPFLKLLPMVADKLKKEQDKVRESLAPTMLKDLTEPRRALPAEGRPEGELLALMESRQALDRKYWTEGKITGAVYHDKPEYMDLVGRVYGMFAFTNPLHPSIHPATRQMDAEVIQMTLDLYRGGDGSCGAFTTGGTESILMAMKSYREWGRATRGIREPNIVCCHTAHAAFDKGGHYFGITVRKCDTDSEMAVDVDHMLSLIDSNTVAIVGSAPQYAHGTVDPIDRLSAIAAARGIGLHVDCCLGGFVLPFARKLRGNIPPFDFALPGVTSMSADTHKYGYATKGTSVVLYRSKELRKHQYFTFPRWQGGNYGTPSTAGSRPGTLSAAAWAAMMRLGEEGYLEVCQAPLASCHAR